MKRVTEPAGSRSLLIVSRDEFPEADLSEYLPAVTVVPVQEDAGSAAVRAVLGKAVSCRSRNISVIGPDASAWEDVADDLILADGEPEALDIVTDSWQCGEAEDLDALANLSVVRTYLESGGTCILVHDGCRMGDTLEQLLTEKMTAYGRRILAYR